MKKLLFALKYWFFLKKFRSSVYPGMYVCVRDSPKIYRIIRIRDEYIVLADNNNNMICKTLDLIYPVSSFCF